VAGGIEEYREMCLKCLFDRKFAEEIIRKQYETARRIVDVRRWWSETIKTYLDWLYGTGWAADQGPAAPEARGAGGRR
jgi:hypothetical protein